VLDQLKALKNPKANKINNKYKKKLLQSGERIQFVSDFFKHMAL
jgi:hypothetical protein